MLKTLLKQEPARIGEFTLSVLALLGYFFGAIDPALTAAIVALVVAAFEIVRAVVDSPATAERKANEITQLRQIVGEPYPD
jgi:hypothetical protein